MFVVHSLLLLAIAHRCLGELVQTMYLSRCPCIAVTVFTNGIQCSSDQIILCVARSDHDKRRDIFEEELYTPIKCAWGIYQSRP